MDQTIFLYNIILLTKYKKEKKEEEEENEEEKKILFKVCNDVAKALFKN